MTVTIEDRDRARHHAGYLSVTEASTFVLGVPAGIPTQFSIEGAFDRLRPEAEARFTRILDIMDAIEQQILDDMELLAVKKVDEIDINEKEFEKLITQYRYWQAALCNMLGVPPNPYDQRFNAWIGGGGGVNVQVQH